MTKKFYDRPYGAFSFQTATTVVCPNCKNAGTVHYDRLKNLATFLCHSCYLKEERFQGDHCGAKVTAMCTSTGKYFRTFVPENKVHGQKLRVKCPYCKESVIGDVSDAGNKSCAVFENIRQAMEPYFHYPLYFQGSYRGKTVWALNREHLQYLIDYLSADIRTVPFDFYERYGTMRSQSAMLPAFMKTAKNREGIVKLLIRMQGK